MSGGGQKKMESSYVKGKNRNGEETVARGINDIPSQTPTAALLSPSPSSSNASSHDGGREKNDGLQAKATSLSHPDLPTFRRQQERSFSGGHRASRSEIIERDAIDTIREHSTAELRDIPHQEEDGEEQKEEAKSGHEDKKQKQNIDEDNTSVNEVNSEEGGKSDSGKLDHFRMFFRRNTLKNSSHNERLAEAAEEAEHASDGKEGGFLEKLISFTGGGLAPAVVDAAMPEGDLEAVGNAELAAELEETAKQIVQAHHTQSAMEGSSIGGESDQGNGLFFTPLADHYDDEFNVMMSSDGEDDTSEATYVAPPQHVRSGVLGTLLQLYQKGESNMSQGFLGVSNKGGGNKRDRTSKSSENLASENYNLPNFKSKRPKGSKLPYGKLKRKNKLSEARITVHIADLLQRHRFLLRLCKALMLFGAPTHRLEEYMVMTSRVLEIDGQFLYMPGCMIISFGDTITRTSEVQLVRCTQGLNLWKLHQVHSIYKQVVHDLISVEDANQVIDKILMDNNLYPAWMSVFLYGFCSSMVTPFAFGGDWINLLVSFFIGSCVGLLQFIVARRSNLYSNVFEITASIVVSFCARALGSISNSNICFGATVQGSLALILPGYIILCGSLELQSRNIVAGSVRMFYAIIYSLFLGFGITLGAALFGWIYKGATSETTCTRSLSPWYNFIFVPGFSIGIALINQARWVQLPMMVLISCMGYLVTYWSSKHFQGSTEFTASMAAFVIGIMGNLYSRIWKGLAMTAMLPAIFVQVPSGIASKSTLLSSVASANTMVSNSTEVKAENTDMRTSISFGVTMIQVSIGISVGLFASTLFVYPFGKKRTGLFTL